MGLAVDAKSVKGGGFLFHDEGKHQYAGVMELSLSGIIALKAIGLLATRLPDGSKGYSLIILVTAQERARRTLWELPLGWRLTGIGGLIAIHRTVDEDAVRAGLKNHTLESILFPKDPVANAPTIIAALDRVFPAKRGCYLFGLMVQLQWGVPTLIEVNLGLIVELGGRTSLRRARPHHRDSAAHGQRSAAPESRRGRHLRSRSGHGGDRCAAGGFASAGAASRSPAGALRARWTSPGSFALAVGGLHHGFTPPAGFPSVERLAVSLTTGDNPKLTCDAYFALTSNTVQFGAHAHLYASAAGFSVTGDAGFDAIQLLPFHFLAEFYAGMQLKRGLAQSVQSKSRGRARGPAAAVGAREVLVRDLVVGCDGPRQLHAGERPEPAAAAIDAFAQLRSAWRCQELDDGTAARPDAYRSRCASRRPTARCGCIRSAPSPCARAWCR